MGLWMISAFGIAGVAFLMWALWKMARDDASQKRGHPYVRLRTIRREQDEEFDESRFEPPDSKAA